MAVFLLNLFLNFSSKKPKSLIVVVLTAQFSPNRVILIGGAQSCNTAQCGEWRSLVSKSKFWFAKKFLITFSNWFEEIQCQNTLITVYFYTIYKDSEDSVKIPRK